MRINGRRIGCKCMGRLRTCRDCGCGEANKTGFFSSGVWWKYMYNVYASKEHWCFMCAEFKLSMARAFQRIYTLSMYYVQYIVSPPQTAQSVNLKLLNKQGYMSFHWSGPVVREKKGKLHSMEGRKDKELTSRYWQQYNGAWLQNMASSVSPVWIVGLEQKHKNCGEERRRAYRVCMVELLFGFPGYIDLCNSTDYLSCDRCRQLRYLGPTHCHNQD